MDEFRNCRILTSHLLNKPSRPLKLKEIVVDRYQKIFVSNPESKEEKKGRNRSQSRGRSFSRRRSKKERNRNDDDEDDDEEDDDEKEADVSSHHINLLDEYEMMRKNLAILVNNHNLTTGANLNPNHMLKITMLHLHMINAWEEIMKKMKDHEVKTKKPLVVEWLPHANQLYDLPNKYEWSNTPLQESIMLYDNLSRCLWVSSQFGNKVLSREDYTKKAFECLVKSHRYINKWKAGEKIDSCNPLSINIEKELIVLTSLVQSISEEESLLKDQIQGAGAEFKTYVDLSSLHFTLFNRLKIMTTYLNEWKSNHENTTNANADIGELEQAKKQHVVSTYTNKVESLLHTTSYRDNKGEDLMAKHFVASWHIMKNVASRYLASPSSLNTEVSCYIQRIEGLLARSLTPSQTPPTKVLPQIDSVHIPECMPEFFTSTRSINLKELRTSLDLIHKSLMI